MDENPTIEVELRPAKKRDLLIKSGLLRLGQIIYCVTPVKKVITGPFVIDQYVNNSELEKFFNEKLLYVPITQPEENIHDLLQTDYKNYRLSKA